MKKNERFFWISLIAMSISNLATTCINIFDIELSDFVFAFFIIVELVSVFAVVYFSIKLWLSKMDSKK